MNEMVRIFLYGAKKDAVDVTSLMMCYYITEEREDDELREKLGAVF
ncbi:hypothetical protein [Paenibacillus sp. IHBB 10380]|nr:hypothetical protein [Paenibacillus sp. IHBB 10380]